MKKLSFLVLVFINFNLAFGQETKIKYALFDFMAKSEYKVAKKQDPMGITLTYLTKVENIPIVNNIKIKKSKIDPKKNQIKDVADFAKFERWSITEHVKTETAISGVSEIGNRKVFYTSIKTEYFEDTSKTKLIGYKFENNNFILEKGITYSINFSSELKLNNLDGFIENGDFKTLDKVKANLIMIRHINLGDVNKIIETLKIKK